MKALNQYQETIIHRLILTIMKPTAAVLLVGILFTTTQCVAQGNVAYAPQRNINVQAQSNDISYNLDLQAVASIFGESRDLEEFEMRLNDYDAQISNLDLNNDGEVDYLRVIESSENNVHLVVVQAVLDRDVYQDVASIVVDRTRYQKTYVQVIGDPYLYGNNYIIEPMYVSTPSIFSFFWGSSYQRWSSPYYWGYYPRYYHNRRPFEVNIYMSHIDRHINRNHSYYYSDRRRSSYYESMHSSIGRNDYAKRYPDRNFSSRNANVTNRYYMQSSRTSNDKNLKIRTGNESGRRTTRSTYDMDGSRVNSNQGSRSNTYDRNSTNRTYSPSDNSSRNSNSNRSQNSESVRRPSNEGNNNNGSRVNQPARGTYQNSNSTPSAPSNNQNAAPRVNQPSRESYQTPARNSENRTPRVEQPSRESYQAPARNSNTETRTAPSVTRDNSPRNTPAASQPSRSAESKPARTSSDNSRSSDNNKSSDNNSRGSRSNDNNSSGRR
ncbi:MAG: hypothetical protein JZU53_09530 [Paludibacter sp.]|nr:hypothetical protein [Paludibacter sp.]